MRSPVRPDGYHERLTTPWWSYPVVVGVAVLVALECSFLAVTLWGQALVVAAFVAVGFGLVWAYGNQRVEVGDGHVRAGQWRLPIGTVRGVAVLDADRMRAEMRRRDDGVYRCVRSWIPTAVMLQVDDPDDLPYWLISTRHPYLLAAALANASERDGAPLTARD
ncbi:MAG TPA: DUF3093 family protein [Mycobacteriales bacterium]